MSKTHLLLCFLILVIFWEIVETSGSESKPEIGIYELKTRDFSITVTNWGATVTSVILPDKYGKFADIVLGYDSIKDYENETTYFGATLGRVANRIGHARFTLNGTTYKLDVNDGNNTLHGGKKGFSFKPWKVEKYHNHGPSPYIKFSYHSFDGEEGFPGDLHVTITYTLYGLNMAVKMKAKALNKATPVNLAHHSYWNIGGQDSGDILSNEIQILGSHITSLDKQFIPTGQITSVKGTPYDLLQPTVISSKINELPKGYNINYVLDGGASKKLKTAAIVHDKKSGRVMEVLTNQSGVQFYTADYLVGVKGKGGVIYQPRDALCLETQGFPDAVNHPNFPSQIVNPGETYVHRLLFKFSIKG